MPEIRELELSEIKELHETRMKKDFPAMELRPYRSMEQLHQKGRYGCCGYFEGNRQLAYACFYHTENSPYELMDLYAVFEELRGQGIGSAFLTELRRAILGKCGIFIEAESLDTAPNTEERMTRERRISFYMKNGAVRTGMRCLLFHVDYEILFLPAEGASASFDEDKTDPDLYGALSGLYRELYGKVYGRLCRLSAKS